MGHPFSLEKEHLPACSVRKGMSSLAPNISAEWSMQVIHSGVVKEVGKLGWGHLSFLIKRTSFLMRSITEDLWHSYMYMCTSPRMFWPTCTCNIHFRLFHTNSCGDEALVYQTTLMDISECPSWNSNISWILLVRVTQGVAHDDDLASPKWWQTARTYLQCWLGQNSWVLV